ncbi:DUF4157 domain-containing protein [Dyella tabacisoli]|uniref:DUF4157 domain-containing protein n=2 Tax=Dyella tabacisoli TaxID=2282381 RepID=A0A369UIT5_9GAMM|nr:DUF4157 domain-containing protein [Dyella tabacisoli]
MADAHAVAAAPDIVHEVLRSPGQSLDPAARAFFEPRFAQDFSQVRVHTDQQAAASASSVGALAYAVGPHITFGTGHYQPATGAGRKLIAHELAHVVQQRAGTGPLRLHRTPDVDAAIADNDWKKVAEILNGYSPKAIKDALDKMKRGVIASIYVGATENPKVGSESAIAIATRPTYLDMNYESELKKQNWSQAAYFLNAFNRDDILDRFKARSDQEVQALRDGAVANVQVGDKSQLAILATQEITKRSAAPAASTNAPAAPGGSATATKNSCCCCAESIDLSDVWFTEWGDPKMAGHFFRPSIKLSYKGTGAASMCTLEWWEKTDITYSEVPKPNTWTQVTNPKAGSIEKWNQQVTDKCPGPETVQLLDPPSLAETPGRTATRKLEFRVIVNSGTGCSACGKPQVKATAKQTLVLVNGKPDKAKCTFEVPNPDDK